MFPGKISFFPLYVHAMFKKSQVQILKWPKHKLLLLLL